MNTTDETKIIERTLPPSEVDALALVTLSPEKYAAAVYQPFKAKLATAIEAMRTVDYDITTTAGMATAIKARATFRDLRVAADKERKARKEPITKVGKLLESGYDDVEALIVPLETLFDGDIKAEEQRKEDVKAAKIAEERARVEAIQGRIQLLAHLAVRYASASAAELAEVITEYDGWAPDAAFEEFAEKAQQTVALSLMALRDLLTSRQQMEQRAAQAEADRLAAEARMETERLALATQKAENDRLAAEMAAERQRLADEAAAQQAAAKAHQDAMEAQAQAERAAATARTAQIQAELDEQRSELAEKARAIAAQQEAYQQVRAAEQQAAADARQREEDHPVALAMNEEFDLLRAEQLAAQSAPTQLDDELDTLLDAADASAPLLNLPPISDNEIIERVASFFGLDYLEAVDRLEEIDFEAAREVDL